MKIKSDNQTFEFVDAAIKIKVNGKDKIFNNRRHHLIIRDIQNAGYLNQYKKIHEDGFLIRVDDGKLEFFNRGQSTTIAKNCNIATIASDVLTSEDLW